MSDPEPEDTGHIQQQPVPGHTENIPADGSDARPDGQRLEGAASTASPDTKPGTPPGTQSEADRTRSPD
ncbi:MAG TPA: MARCKS-like protein [Paraburkholderia sp.]|uniref:MARCKS-like protein n=1 Tax=Paraburkholderia sp. TaxID=1926495 RepID=UPI002ED01599